MTSHSRSFARDGSSHRISNLSIQKRADEIAAEMFARAEKRRRALEQLKSALYSSAERIRAWEKLYGLRLPFAASHPVLVSVAGATELTLEQIRDEQKHRNEQAGRQVSLPGVYG